MMKVKEESEKVVLKLNIQKTKIMASGPFTSWEIDGETVETVSVARGIHWGATHQKFSGTAPGTPPVSGKLGCAGGGAMRRRHG